MKYFRICNVAWIVFALAASTALGQQPAKPGKLIVHEWGTFLSVQGSDGISLGGMVASDEVLPTFVEMRSIKAWQRTLFNSKMETPVTYFYVDRPMSVQVKVEMNQGILSHWFPLVRSFGPPLNVQPNSKSPLKSHLDWGRVNLTPDDRSKPAPVPNVPPELTWRFARETDAALVTVPYTEVRSEEVSRKQATEKFLFYRGVGGFPLPLTIKTAEVGGQLRLTLGNQSKQDLVGLFGINVENGSIQFGRLESLAGNESKQLALMARLSAPRPIAEGTPLVKQALADSLVEAGLYAKEALAMVHTWERSYFYTEGLRVLYIIPRRTVDEVIPLHIRPAPEQVVRVMVGRVEVLTPQKEKQIEKYVADLGANAFTVRQAATDGLSRLGRITEPALRRVLASSNDAEVRARAKMLVNQLNPTPW